MNINISQLLHSALIRASLNEKRTISEQIEKLLRENPTIIKYLEEITNEPDLIAVDPFFVRQMRDYFDNCGGYIP
jgi:hypothetical protein